MSESESAPHPSQPQPGAIVDDAFELYDLRVEVVCPPGARILCGAKPGDHFVLQGEMMYLPPRQGFSIYSMGESMGKFELEFGVGSGRCGRIVGMLGIGGSGIYLDLPILGHFAFPPKNGVKCRFVPL